MTNMRTVRRVTAACFAVVLGAAVLSGCDTVGSSGITLQKDVDFRFRFSTAEDDGVQPIHVNADAVVDFADLLVAEGFSREDIISVTVQSVHLERILPIETTLDVFERAAFSLTATGTTAPPIAEIDDLPTARGVDLSVVNRNITQVAVQPEFRGRLTVVPQTGHDEDYVLAATMEVVVEVEGI